MRVTDTFNTSADEALWNQLTADPVTRVDSGRRGGHLVIDVDLAPLVDPRQVAVRQEEDTLVLVRSTDRAVLYRMPLHTPVGRPTLRRTSTGLSVTAPLTGPALPIAVRPGLRPAGRIRRLRAALGRAVDRLRSLFTGN